MTNRENFFKAVGRKEPERIPFYFTMCESLINEFEKRYGTRDYFAYYNMPFRTAGVKPTKQKIDFTEYFKKLPNVDEITEWGLGLAHSGEYHFATFVSPMRDFTKPEEVYAFPLPDVLADYRWEGLKERIAELKAQDYVTLSGPDEVFIQIFEFSWYLRGLENLLGDMLVDEEMAAACLDRMTDVMCKICERWGEAGVDVLIMGDDVGTERDMMMSPELWRKWLKPRLAKAIESAKKINPNILVYFHSDGYIIPVIEDLIEIGVDILNPIQPECMDPIEVKRMFGDRLAFWGTIGTQTTMPFGTPDEVKRVCIEMIEKVGKGGGLILAPTHILEPEVPFLNIEAFVSTVQNFNSNHRKR